MVCAGPETTGYYPTMPFRCRQCGSVAYGKVGDYNERQAMTQEYDSTQDTLIPFEMTMATPGGREMNLQGHKNADGKRGYLAYVLNAYLLMNIAPDGETANVAQCVFGLDEAREWVVTE